MSSYKYALRAAGGVAHAQTADAAHGVIPVGGATAVSLNILPMDVAGYAQQGSDLVITLMDGETITLQGFFAEARELFLSRNGEFYRVELGAAEDGGYVVAYEEVPAGGKWSAYDEMAILDLQDVEPVFAPLVAPAALGALGLGGGALALAGLSGGGNGGGNGGDDDDDGNAGNGGGGGGTSVDPDTTPPTVVIEDGVRSTGDMVNAEGRAAGHVIAGRSEPGATVAVTVDGVTRETVVAADGSWSVTFAPDEIAEGEYATPVSATATDAAGNSARVGDMLDVDTVPPDVDLETVAGDDVINAAEAAAGVVLRGTGEPGAVLDVAFLGQSQAVTVAADGTWSAPWAAAAIPAGTSANAVTITATDAAGNSSVETFPVAVDTETYVTLDDGLAGGDDIANAAERLAGIVLTGTAEAGAAVEVTFAGATETTTATDAGTWAATFDSADVQDGSYAAPIDVTATDRAGNTATTSGTLTLDTEISETVASGLFTADGRPAALQWADTGENISFHRLNADGTTDPLDVTEMRAGEGEPVMTWLDDPLPDGAQLVVAASDDAGNRAGTLIVFDNMATNAGTVEHGAIGDFAISTIDLDDADDATLMLDAELIRGLSETTDELTIHGGADDTVHLAGGTKVSEMHTADGGMVDIYTVGDDGVTLVVDQDVNVVI